LCISLKCRGYQNSKQEKEGEIEISSPRHSTAAYTPARQSNVLQRVTSCGVTNEIIPESEQQLCGAFQNDSAQKFNTIVF
jgi:hypothetical protein